MIYSQMDIVIVIDGKEGTGKSRTARNVADYINFRVRMEGFEVEMNTNNIHFSTIDYFNFSKTKGKYSINLLDESRESLNKKRSMSASNVFFTNWISENRDKHQVHIILLPAIHDLDNYISLWRMSLLIHMLKSHKEDLNRKSKYSLKRGYFTVYENNTYLQNVFHNNMKYGRYAYPKIPKYSGKMLDYEPFSEAEYNTYTEKKRIKRETKYEDLIKVKKSTKKDLVMAKLIKTKMDLGESKAAISRDMGINIKTIDTWLSIKEKPPAPT